MVTPVIGVIVLAIPVWGDLRPGQPSPYNVLPWLTIGLIAVGVAYALILGFWRPQVLEQAPALLEGADSLAVDPLPIGNLAVLPESGRLAALPGSGRMHFVDDSHSH